jgi:aspartate carbamoyltransferase catalytic subunit
MPRHLIEISDMSREEIDRLFSMADDGPLPDGLAGLTYLSAFFQESTRTRLGFMSAAARQGASVLDAGSADRLRLEPQDDQQMVLAGVADITAVRHWDASFARRLAYRDRCGVVNAGAGGASHPTQALIDAYTLTKAFGRDIRGLRVLFLGPLLRSAVSFRELGDMLGMDVSQWGIETDPPRGDRLRCQAALRAADVIYVQSLSDTDYDGADLNAGSRGRALPEWTVDAILRSKAFVMHALPRGPELPDSLMWGDQSLVAQQVEDGLAVRSAILRWLVQPSSRR